MTRLRMSFVMVVATCLFTVSQPAFAENENRQQPDYLALVKAYAETMIEQGRDVYGEVHSPLFAAALDRKTMKIGEFPILWHIMRHYAHFGHTARRDSEARRCATRVTTADDLKR